MFMASIVDLQTVFLSRICSRGQVTTEDAGWGPDEVGAKLVG